MEGQGEMDVDCRVPQRVMKGKEGRRETAYNPGDEDGHGSGQRDNSSTMARGVLPFLYPRHGLSTPPFPKDSVNY